MFQSQTPQKLRRLRQKFFFFSCHSSSSHACNITVTGCPKGAAGVKKANFRRAQAVEVAIISPVADPQEDG